MDRLFDLLPLLLIVLICPLMMWIMMRTIHGDHEGNVPRTPEDRSDTPTTAAPLNRNRH